MEEGTFPDKIESGFKVCNKKNMIDECIVNRYIRLHIFVKKPPPVLRNKVRPCVACQHVKKKDMMKGIDQSINRQLSLPIPTRNSGFE